MSEEGQDSRPRSSAEPSRPRAPRGPLRRLWRLFGAGEDTGPGLVRRELLGGVTTFLTMSYIVVVNPRILAEAGIPLEGALFATCVSAAVACLLMGIWARYPIALAPGMGLNAYFTWVAVRTLLEAGLSEDLAWRAALGAVFLSGLVFLALSAFRLRAAIVDAVPRSLKHAVAAGIGLFIAFIGLQNAGLVVADEATLVALGDVGGPGVLGAALGVLVIAALLARGSRGAVLWGILVAFLVILLAGEAPMPEQVVSLPDPSGSLLALRPLQALQAGVMTVLFVFLFVDLFDTVGTLIAVAEQGGFLDESGRLPRAHRALQADAVGTIVGSLLGTSTVTSYIESTTGIAAGARTGLANLPVALLFLACIFLSPLVAAVPAAATAPALIAVGALMISSLASIDWKDPSEGFPAFLAFATIPLTFSISDGIAAGFIAYSLVKAAAGKTNDVSPLVWILTAVFLLRYALLALA